MRPIRRSNCPIAGDYADYASAKTELVSRVGSGWLNGEHVASYCSYCERKIETNLAVEHTEPKDGPFGSPHLIGRWTNFLLACVNCNSTKSSKQVLLATLLLPDRDNTFSAFEYRKDGTVVPAAALTPAQRGMAVKTLALVGLDKRARNSFDANGKLIAQDRSSQRMQAWDQALQARQIYEANPTNEGVKSLIVCNALHVGFFSVWMAAFDGLAEIRLRLIEAMAGTQGSGCFDAVALPVNPAGNADLLLSGGKC